MEQDDWPTREQFERDMFALIGRVNKAVKEVSENEDNNKS